MQEELQHLREKEEKVTEQVANYQIYKDFLQQVVKESPEFQKIQDIFSR